MSLFDLPLPADPLEGHHHAQSERARFMSALAHSETPDPPRTDMEERTVHAAERYCRHGSGQIVIIPKPLPSNRFWRDTASGPRPARHA